MSTTGFRVQVLLAALLFSTGGAAIKACTLTSWQVASFRSGIAAVTLLILLPDARKLWTPRTAAVGTAYAATMILYATANKLTTAANTIFLQGTAPLYILLLSPWLLRETVRRRDLVFMASLAVGMALFFVGEQRVMDTAPDPLLGNILGVVSGVTWALTIMGLRWLGTSAGPDGDPSASAVACGNLIACLVALPMALPVVSSTASDWLLVLFLGVCQIAVAYIFLIRGVRGVGALEVSLLLLLEPVLNPIWAWIVHGEQPSGWALVGGAIILSATIVNTWVGSRRPADDAA
jgi:drug/metabolite transporter (DMT)-like permease